MRQIQVLFIENKISKITSGTTFGNRSKCPRLDGTGTGKLTERHLEEVERFADQKENNQVRNEEGAAAVFVLNDQNDRFQDESKRDERIEKRAGIIPR